MPIGGSAYGRAKQRHSTEGNYDSVNPIPAAGEILVGVDAPGDVIVKMGDGTSTWDDAVVLYPHPEGGGGGGEAFPINGAETRSNNLVGFQRPTGEGGIDITSIVWDDPLDLVTEDVSTWLLPLSGGDQGKLELSEVGWFDVSVMCFFTFPAATPVTYLKALFVTGTNYAGVFQQYEAPVVDAAGNLRFAFQVSLGIIHSNGFAAIQPEIRWNEGVTNATTARLIASVIRLG